MSIVDRTNIEYVDIKRMSEISGISVRQLQRLRKEGLPSEDFGMAMRRFDPDAVMAWLRARSTERN